MLREKSKPTEFKNRARLKSFFTFFGAGMSKKSTLEREKKKKNKTMALDSVHIPLNWEGC